MGAPRLLFLLWRGGSRCGCVKGRRADCRLLNDSLEKLFIMLMYGYVAKWKSRFVGWVALLSIIGEFVALSGVVGGSYVRLSAFFIFGVIGFVAWALMLKSDMMEEERPVLTSSISRWARLTRRCGALRRMS